MTVPAWARVDADRNTICIFVHVQPNARSTAVAGRHGEALKIRVAAPAVEDKANRALLAFLGEQLGVAASHLSILRGGHGRSKAVLIEGPGRQALDTLGYWDTL